MHECEKRVGRNDCKNCVLYDDEMGMCLNDVNVVKAKHGKWIEHKILKEGFWECSSCGFVSEALGASILYKYCPHCGARMDGE